MAEYIEREAMIDEIEGTTWYHISCQKNLVEGAACEADAFYKATDIYNVIKSAPTADVVEVVRCKDCAIPPVRTLTDLYRLRIIFAVLENEKRMIRNDSRRSNQNDSNRYCRG